MGSASANGRLCNVSHYEDGNCILCNKYCGLSALRNKNDERLFEAGIERRA